MEQNNLEKWDSDRYRELNAYFRIRIKTLLESDPFLQGIIAQHNSIQLQDLVARMTEPDQQRWSEFMVLDQMKLHLDIQNHLEGKGTPLDTQNGFGPNLTDEEDYW